VNIIERVFRKQTVFDVVIRDESGHQVVDRTVYVPYAKTNLSDGTPYHIIYDEYMNPIDELVYHLNVRMKGYSPNSVDRAVTSLRLLAAFCEATGCSGFHIPEELCSDFDDFLRRGGKVCSRTAAEYFNDIKTFLLATDHAGDPLMESTTRRRREEGADGVERLVTVTTYTHSPKVSGERDKMCPPHNSVGDYVAITDVMGQTKRFSNGKVRLPDITGRILLTLLFFLARRIGACLGLTIEDVSSCLIVETGQIAPSLYFRERLTDVKGQMCKFGYKPKSKADYASKDYIREYNRPKNCFIVTQELHDLLVRYVINIHGNAARNQKQRYATTVADTVNPEKFREEWGRYGITENHYLFLDTLGDRLGRETWRQRLHGYFREAGVAIGPGKSPSHSWRHTLAYTMKKELGMTDAQIAAYLGQDNPASSQVYSRPDLPDIADMHEAITAKIKEMIDNLKNG